jgi:spore germination protein YaaH
MKKILGVLIVCVALFITWAWIHLARTYPTTSPLKSSLYFMYNLLSPHKNMTNDVLGFLPYWRVDDIQYIRHDIVTEVNYFTLFADDEGNIIKVVDGQTNPGWREWESQNIKDLIAKTQIMGGTFSVTLAVQNNDAIENILDDKNVQKKLIANILHEIETKKLNGVNIDFEYLGEPDDAYKQRFTEFSKSLRQELNKKSPKAKIYLSIMPRSARDKDLFDFPSLVPLYDKFIGMSYEYVGQGSEIATATAPMTGFKENKFYFDVTTTYEDFLKAIPKEKILMGIPYYGRDWAVETGSRIESKTLSSDHPDSYSAVISYARAKEMKEFKKSQCKFDEVAKQPWCWYTDKDNVDHQVWFENEKSIGIKFDFVKQHDLSGVAIWVLGYDKNYPELWDVMKNKFAK